MIKKALFKEILKNNNRKNDDCRNVYYIGDGYSDFATKEFVHKKVEKQFLFINQINTMTFINIILKYINC